MGMITGYVPVTGKIVVLTGGIGGAKLVLGLSRVAPPDNLTAIVNTGDDFSHLGLRISPDIDTLLYTLADKGDLDKGWGRRDETWTFMTALKSLGGEGWFALGDGDLALHIERTRRLAAGQSLSAVTQAFAKAWGIPVTILPMSDDPVATMVSTDRGELEFQRYFVELRCAPAVSAIRFDGAETARPAPGVIAAIESADIVIIAPSNPYLSIDPILAIDAIAEALRNAQKPVVCVSPLIGGKAVKGPTAKLMRELGVPPDNASIAAHYRGIISAIVIDEQDKGPALGVAQAVTDTMMRSLADRERVARAALTFAKDAARIGAESELGSSGVI